MQIALQAFLACKKKEKEFEPAVRLGRQFACTQKNNK